MTTDLSTDRDPATAPGGRGRRNLLVVVVALAVVVVGVVLWWVQRDDAPDAVDLEAATASIDEATGQSGDGAAATIADASGVWTVDTSVGEFSFEDSTGTYVGFRVAEELAGVGEIEAVGRTPEVTGTVTIDGTTVTDVVIEADMAALTTNDRRRDNNVARALDTATFPTAAFVLTEPIDLGADPASGEPLSATAVGELTVHGETNPVEIDLEARLVGDTIVVVGSTEIVFADFGVSVPSAPIVLSAEDNGVVELQLFLARS